MTRQLTVIRDRVKSLIDAIEAAADAPQQAVDQVDDPVVRTISRHPLAYAVAMFGLGLLGERLLARAVHSRPTYIPEGVHWWNPPDSEGMIH